MSESGATISDGVRLTLVFRISRGGVALPHKKTATKNLVAVTGCLDWALFCPEAQARAMTQND